MTTAFQFLNVEWNTKQGSDSVSAFSQELSQQDAEYILNITRNVSGSLRSREDEDNPLSSNVMYLMLPSGGKAILRSGYCDSEDPDKSDCRIIHAFIRPDGAEYDITPMLYVNNNCFITALDENETEKLRKEKTLPATTFPKAQYKLNQSEVEKFFSPHKKKTLELLIQSIIDAHENKRKIIFNDAKYSNLKYWFWGIHCCLPSQILESLTYSTYASEKNPDIKLICGACENSIDNVSEINDGNFVIDLCGKESCSDIEAVKYSTTIVPMFVSDMEKTGEVISGIESLISRYRLSLSSAANIYNLLNYQFDKFDAVYDIRYSLDKLNALEPESIPPIIRNLWTCIKENKFKFPINENLIPLLSFIFKNSDNTVKDEITDLVYRKTSFFGISRERSLSEYAEQIKHNVPFIWEYLPYTLIGENKFDEYVSAMDDTMRSGALFCMIVDNIDSLSETFGRDTVYSKCRRIITGFYEKESLELLTAIIDRCKPLPDDFFVATIVGGFKTLKRETPDIIDHLGDVFVFSVIEGLIDRPSVAALFVAEYAREGYYNDLILTYYYGLMQKYPEQTEAITSILKKDPRYTQFISDMALYVFMNKESTTKEDVENYCIDYYLKGFDRENIFEQKLKGYLDSLIPVIQIREAEYFLTLIQNGTESYKSSVLSLLYSYIAEQNLSDIYDYYNLNHDNYRNTRTLLSKICKSLPAQFESAKVCFDFIQLCAGNDREQYRRAALYLRSFSLFRDADSVPSLKDDFIRVIFRSYIRLVVRIYDCEEDRFGMLRRLLSPTEEESSFAKLLKAYFETGGAEVDKALSTIILYILVYPEDGSAIKDVCESYMSAFSSKEKRLLYIKLIGNCRDLQDKKKLAEYLLDLYYVSLSPLAKLFSPSRRRLRKKLLLA